MTSHQIAADVARGLQVKAQILALLIELKAIESRLMSAGEVGEQIPLQDENREGKQYLARGENQILPVRFESDLIVGSIENQGLIYSEILEILGDLLPRFFKPSSKLDRVPKDGESFRKLARNLLEPQKFARLIRAATARDKNGIAKSRVVVAWDDSQPLEPVA